MKYLPTLTGSTRGAVSGRQISYRKGEPTEDLPKGELDHCGFEKVQDKKMINKSEIENAVVSGNEVEMADVDAETDETEDESPDTQVDERFLNLPKDTKFPHHYGGGNYYLSNGEAVSGKEEALKAQTELESKTN